MRRRKIIRAARIAGIMMSTPFLPFAGARVELTALSTAPTGAQLLAQAPSRFSRLNGVNVHYKSIGKGGPALVLVHGWACDMNFWREQLPAFAGKARIILLDLPGHGRSDKPRIAYTMDLFARAVEAVLRDAGVARAVLAGHSMGTPVIRQFYRLYPEKSLALVAVDGAFRPWTIDPAQIESMVKPLREPDHLEHARTMVEGMLPPQMPAALREEIKQTMLAVPQHVMAGAFEGMMHPSNWKNDRIGIPLLVVVAKSSSWPSDNETFIRTLASHVDYRIFEGVGHFLMLEKPALLNAALLDFLHQHKLLAQ